MLCVCSIFPLIWTEYEDSRAVLVNPFVQSDIAKIQNRKLPYLAIFKAVFSCRITKDFAFEKLKQMFRSSFFAPQKILWKPMPELALNNVAGLLPTIQLPKRIPTRNKNRVHIFRSKLISSPVKHLHYTLGFPKWHEKNGPRGVCY